MQLLSPETPLLEFNARPQASETSTATASPEPKRTLLVLASQHGDEPCGVLAVNRLLAEEHERRKKEADDSSSSWPFGENDGDGSCAFDRVVFALGNPLAFSQNARQVDENLNRCFPVEKDLSELVRDGSSSSSYERRRAGELAPLLAGAAAVLDLHSASAPSPAFAMFPPSSAASASLARALLGIPFAVSDHTGEGLGLAIEWAARHGRGGRGGGGGKGSKGGDGAAAATAAVTLEAGQHLSPSSVEASVRAIRAALRWRGEEGPPEEEGGGGGEGKEKGEEAAAEEENKNLCPPTLVVVRKGEVVRRGFRWETTSETRERVPPEAFSRFAFGELVASDDVKGELRCEVAGGARIVLPAARPVEGEDAFLWGEDE